MTDVLIEGNRNKQCSADNMQLDTYMYRQKYKECVYLVFSDFDL